MKEQNEHIENNELKKEAPLLFNLEKKNNFQIPEGYFDSLIDNIEDKIKNEKSVSLDHIKKQNNFAIPDGYFDRLPEQIEDKINSTDNANVVHINKFRFTRLISVAASVAAILAVVFLLKDVSFTTKELANLENSFESLSVEEFEEAIFSVNNEELVTYAEFDDIEEIEEYTNDIEEIDLDFTSSEIDEYLSSDYYFDVEF